MDSNHIKGKIDREKYIIKLMSQNGSVKISDLSKNLQVSRETIRRDLQNLESKNMLHCTYGGAIAATPANAPYEINSAHIKCRKEKNTIAKKAAEFINDYEAIIILASTTAERLGPYLNEKNHLTVITNSLTIAKYASPNPTNSVILLGGNYRHMHQATLSNETASSLQRYRADKLLFSPSGVSIPYGVTDNSENDMHLIQSALSVSKTSILLGDYTKFGLVTLHIICALHDIDIIISDSNLSQKKVSELSSAKANIIIANDVSEASIQN